MNILEILQKEKKYQDIVNTIKEAEKHNNIYIGNPIFKAFFKR